jgi:hypothetical protein
LGCSVRVEENSHKNIEEYWGRDGCKEKFKEHKKMQLRKFSIYGNFRSTKIFDPGKERGAYFFEGFPESFEEIWFEELYG